MTQIYKRKLMPLHNKVLLLCTRKFLGRWNTACNPKLMLQCLFTSARVSENVPVGHFNTAIWDRQADFEKLLSVAEVRCCGSFYFRIYLSSSSSVKEVSAKVTKTAKQRSPISLGCENNVNKFLSAKFVSVQSYSLEIRSVIPTRKQRIGTIGTGPKEIKL